MRAIDPEREDACQVVIDFVTLANDVVDLPGMSVPLSITKRRKELGAEPMALRPVSGCSAILDACHRPRLMLRKPGAEPGTETGAGRSAAS